MPARRKSSPTKAKKSPTKRRSKSRSRSRSTSKPRAKATRSRSRSASRTTVVTEIVKEQSSLARTPRASPGRPAKSASAKAAAKASPASITKQVQREEIITPTRASRRIVEKTSSYQVTRSTGDKDGITVTKTSTSVHSSSKSASNTAAGEGGLGYAGAAMFVVLILVTYLLALSCDKTQCTLLKLPKCPANWQAFLNLEVFGFIIAFYCIMAILALLPIGGVVKAPVGRDGRRPDYRCNAWLSFLAAAAAFGYCVKTGFPVKMSYVHDHLLQFVSAGIILSVLLAVVLFIMGRDTPGRLRTVDANGTFCNDLVMGRELNPRYCKLEIKHFICRCMCIAWLAIDWMYLMDSYSKSQKIEPALGLVVLCHTFYVMLNLKNEASWFTTNGSKSDGAGLFFCCATMSFAPYVFTLQTRFLYLYPAQGLTNNYALAAIFILNAVGLVLFNGSNWQKNAFRQNPYDRSLAHLESIPTSTGKSLICSSYWGIVRRPNYLGDLMMALAWSLPCGFHYGLPYTYLAYMILQTVTRITSDERACHSRYGDAWVKYTQKVRYRVIPFIF